MAYAARSVYEYEFEDVPRPPDPPVAPIVVAAPSPLPTTPFFVHTLIAADGAIYQLVYRVTQRPEAFVGILESCHTTKAPRG